MMMCVQLALHISPLRAGFVFVPLALTFVAASPRSVQCFFAIESGRSARPAVLAAFALFALSIIACAAFLGWMRRASVAN